MTMPSADGPRPPIAAHHWSIHRLEIDAACARASALGYDGLDLAVGDTGTGERLSLATLATDPAARRGLADIGRRHGIRFTDLVAGAILAPEIDDEALSRQLRLLGELAPHLGELGLDAVTVIPGLVGDVPLADATDLVASELTRLVRVLGDAGISVSIEPHRDSVTDTPERTLRMLADVPGLRLTLDYSHFVSAGFDADDIEPLHPYARHFHIRQASPGRLAAPVSEGSIDHRRLVARLRDIGYHGALTTEYVDSPWYGQNAVDADAENEEMRRELVGLVDELWGAG